MVITIREFEELLLAEPIKVINSIDNARNIIQEADRITKATELTDSLFSIELILASGFDKGLNIWDKRKSFENQRIDILFNIKLIESEINKRLGVTDIERKAYSIKLNERLNAQNATLKAIKDNQRADKIKAKSIKIKKGVK